MKTYFFLSFLLSNIISLSLFGQDFKIEAENPILRQNQQLMFYLDMEFFKKYIKSSTDSSFDISSKNGLISTVVAKDTGIFTIGPFELVFNGQKLQSDSFMVKVLPPVEPKPGMYIHYFYDKGLNYVWIEQIFKEDYILDKADKQTATKEKAYSLNKLVSLQFMLVSNSYLVSSCPPIVKNLETVTKKNANQQYLYASRTYKIINKKGIKLKLSREHFHNLPDDFELPLIEIK